MSGTSVFAIIAGTQDGSQQPAARGEGSPELTRKPWPSTGFVYEKQILGKHGGPIPLSPSTWWKGVKEGRFPPPIKVGGRTVWSVRAIDDLIDRLEREGGDGHRSRRLPAPLRPRAMQVEAQK